jgi:hypothetical protein
MAAVADRARGADRAVAVEIRLARARDPRVRRDAHRIHDAATVVDGARIPAVSSIGIHLGVCSIDTAIQDVDATIHDVDADIRDSVHTGIHDVRAAIRDIEGGIYGTICSVRAAICGIAADVRRADVRRADVRQTNVRLTPAVGGDVSLEPGVGGRGGDRASGAFFLRRTAPEEHETRSNGSDPQQCSFSHDASQERTPAGGSNTTRRRIRRVKHGGALVQPGRTPRFVRAAVGV